MFKIKNEYELELQTPKTMKLFGSSKILIDKTENGENVPSLQVVKVVLVRCNLTENQCQKESEIDILLHQINLISNVLLFYRTNNKKVC